MGDGGERGATGAVELTDRLDLGRAQPSEPAVHVRGSPQGEATVADIEIQCTRVELFYYGLRSVIALNGSLAKKRGQGTRST